MFPQELLDGFVKIITRSITKKGIYPFPVMHLDGKGVFHVGVLDLKPEQCFDLFWSIVCRGECSAIIMGLDRFTKPGQGTEFNDVLTVVCWWDDPKVTWKATHRVGVINYQHEPRIVRPIDWGNAHWNKQLTFELEKTRPLLKIPTMYAPVVP